MGRCACICVRQAAAAKPTQWRWCAAYACASGCDACSAAAALPLQRILPFGALLPSSLTLSLSSCVCPQSCTSSCTPAAVHMDCRMHAVCRHAPLLQAPCGGAQQRQALPRVVCTGMLCYPGSCPVALALWESWVLVPSSRRVQTVGCCFLSLCAAIPVSSAWPGPYRRRVHACIALCWGVDASILPCMRHSVHHVPLRLSSLPWPRGLFKRRLLSRNNPMKRRTGCAGVLGVFAGARCSLGSA